MSPGTLAWMDFSIGSEPVRSRSSAVSIGWAGGGSRLVLLEAQADATPTTALIVRTCGSENLMGVGARIADVKRARRAGCPALYPNNRGSGGAGQVSPM